MKENYRKLDLEKIKNRKHRIISSKEALKDIIPFKWENNPKKR